MSSFKVENLLILNQHAERIRASLFTVDKILNATQEKILERKDIEVLCKAIKDGKTFDQEKFPHLKAETVKSIGELLRLPFNVLAHFYQFQTKALTTLNDALIESKFFDLSWNNIFVMPILKLFTNYCRLNIFVNSIEGIRRVPVVYGYCYKVTQKKDLSIAQYVADMLNNRSDYKQLISELQIVQDKFFTIYKSNIAILSRLVNAGQTYTWRDLNLNDNPNPLDKKKIFFKPEYIIMQNLQLFCECYVFFCIFCSHVLHDNPQFTDLFVTILAHCGNVLLYGDSNVEYKTVMQKVMQGKGKKAADLDVFNLVSRKQRELAQIRSFRKRKLAMILSEYVSASKFDTNVIMNKFPVVQAALGFANFEIYSELNSWSQQPSASIIKIIHAAADLMTVLLSAVPQLQRFLVFNFREYDGAFLESAIMSNTIPQVHYKRLAVVVQALKSIDIEDYDNGTRYDLTGLELTLLREMAAFNTLSRSRGVIHLAPLFTLLSSIFYRVHVYNNLETEFLDTCQLHRLWAYNSVFLRLARVTENDSFPHAAALFKLAHFYTADTLAADEIPQFRDAVSAYVDNLKMAIILSVGEKVKNLQAEVLPELVLQTKIHVVEKVRAAKEQEQKPKNTKLSQIPIGKESTMANRRCLTEINDDVQSINEIMHNISQIGIIRAFDKEINVVQLIRAEILNFFASFYRGLKFRTPFEAIDEIGITKIIFENVMNAAGMNCNVEYSKCYKNLTKVTFDKSENGNITIGKDCGHFTLQFSDIYTNLLDKLLNDSFFSNVTQMFVSNNPKVGTIPSLLASQSAIKVIDRLLGTDGLAFLDILAVDSFAKEVKKLVKLFKDTKVLDTLRPCLPKEACDERKFRESIAKFVSQLLAKYDYVEKPVLPSFLKLLTHLGSIARFRRLIRNSVTLTQKESEQFPFLAKGLKPEDDSVLMQRLSDTGIADIAKDAAFGPFIGSILAASLWVDVTYSTEHNAFSNNGHLYTVPAEAFLALVHKQKSDFDPVRVMSTVVQTAYLSLGIGNSTFSTAKGRKGRFPFTELHIMLDHIIQNSMYLDYSYLQKVVPYQTIRHIYSRIYSAAKTEKQSK